MWHVDPVSWLSRAYRVSERGKTLGTLEFGTWSERGGVVLGDRRFPIRREGFWSPKFHLMDGHTTLATVRSAGAFRRGFYVVHGDAEYRLDPSSLFGRSFDLTQRGRLLGDVRAVGLFSRRARADLDEHLPEEVRLFVVWLVLLAWKRAAAAAGAAAS